MPDKKEKVNLHAGHRQRVKDNVRKYGTEQLADHQLLELMLFYSIPRADTNALAHALLKRFKSLRGVLNATYEELCSVDGVGESTAIMLLGMFEMACRANKPDFDKRPVYKKREDYEALAVGYLSGELKETAVTFYFDRNGRLKGETVFARGSENSVAIDHEKVLRQAVFYNAAKVLIAHNHPVDVASPSVCDIETTRVLSVWLRKAGILVVDHIIVGGKGDIYSMYNSEATKGYFAKE